LANFPLVLVKNPPPPQKNQKKKRKKLLGMEIFYLKKIKIIY